MPRNESYFVVLAKLFDKIKNTILSTLMYIMPVDEFTNTKNDNVVTL